jgi:hypothetical protein
MKENLPFDDFVKKQFNNFEPEVPLRIWNNIVAARKQKPKGFWGLLGTGKGLLIATVALLSAVSIYWFAVHPQIGSEKNLVADKPVASSSDSHKTFSNEMSSATNSAQPDNSQQPGELNRAETADKSVAKGYDNAPLHDDNNVVSHQRNTNPINGPRVANSETGNPTADQHITNEIKSSGTVTPVQLARRNYLIEMQNLKSAPSAKNVSKAPKLKLPDCPTIEKDAAGNKKYIEVYAGPDYAFSNYRASGDTGNINYAQKRKDATSYSFAFSAGARYTKVFNNGISARAGINYSQINEKFKYVNASEIRNVMVITTRVIIRAPGDTIYVNDTLRFQQTGTRVKTSTNKLHSIDIPLMMGYELGNGRLHANISAGAIINLYAWYKGEQLDTSYQPVSITTGKGNPNYQYKTNIGVGFISSVSVYYKLNDTWHLFAEPYFRYNLAPMSKPNLNIQQKYHTAGMRMGIRLDLGQRNR